MQNPRFRKTPLSAGIAVALGAMTLSPALAQDASDEVMEEIVTTGIRGSLIQSMDRKRDAKGVVDAITAEDIGKFPDQNLAESLSRITGVSIERSNNEGSLITVRGMGPEFNLVTLNGRTMPTGSGRSFDFGDIASEGVRAVEVYKTGRADLPTGGIGATVNIITAKPFDNLGFQSVVSAKMVHETSSSDASVANLDEFTPELAAMFSNTFADDTIGVMVSASYQERDNREENAAVAQWVPNVQLDPNSAAVTNNNQRADGTFWHPQNIGYGWSDISRDRINGQVVLQYAPTDRLTATLDYTYSEVDFEKDANSTGIWFECPNTDAVINERGTVTEVSQACGDYSTNVGRDHTIKENNSLGLNIDFMVSDSLTLKLDVHSSSSEFDGGDIGGGEKSSNTSLFIGNTSCPWCPDAFGPAGGPATATIANQTAFYGPGGIPTFDVSFVGGDGNPQAGLIANDFGSLFAQAFNTDVDNDIDQVQFGGTWENMDNGSIRSIDFGYSRTDQKYTTRGAYSGQLPAGFWLTSAQYWDGNAVQTGSLSGLLSGFSNGGSFSFDDYYTLGFDALVDGYETVGVGDPIADVYWPFWAADYQDTANGRGRLWSGPLGNNGASIVDEEIDSLYAQATFEDEFNGMAMNLVVGVRYEESKMTSESLEVPATGITWVAGSEFSYQKSPDQQPRTGLGENDYWLPSLDVDMEVYQDVIARFSYSRTLARPPIGNLSPARDFVGNPNVRSRFVNAGNPGLLPFLSDNFDLSLEYYYGDGNYASIGYFKKKVDNFLVSTTVQETFPGLTDPYISAEAEQARSELVAEGTNPDDQAVFSRINLNRGVALTTPIAGLPGDPLAVFDVTTTENAEIGNLSGWELAVQHFFGDTGFGVAANYTAVNGDVDPDRDLVGVQFALAGLSDSGNLSVFFENEIVSARIAFNWRDEFFNGFDADGGPTFVEAYAPIDLNVTWYATDQLDVFFEAINITEEVTRTYSRYEEQFLRGNEYGSRFNIGARYNFD